MAVTAEAERNPREIIDAAPMAWRQWLAIAITVGLNALDGIDVLSVSYAAPGIAREWNLAPSTLGWVLSMELLGMAIGSVALGGLADRAGRRTTILIALVVMAVGMFGASSWRHLKVCSPDNDFSDISGTWATLHASTAPLAR